MRGGSAQQLRACALFLGADRQKRESVLGQLLQASLTIRIGARLRQSLDSGYRCSISYLLQRLERGLDQQVMRTGIAHLEQVIQTGALFYIE